MQLYRTYLQGTEIQVNKLFQLVKLTKADSTKSRAFF